MSANIDEILGMQNTLEIGKIKELVGSVLKNLDGRDDVVQLLTYRQFTGMAVEVGTWTGVFANRILENTNITKLFCVDPYSAYDDFKDAMNFMNLEAVYNHARSTLGRFGERIEFIREFSDQAVLQFEDESLDFAYIDGNHQYEFAKRDFDLWWPKIREGGLLIGDDCIDLDDEKRNKKGDVTFVHVRDSSGNPESYADYGVFNALREFVNNNDLGYVLFGSQFVVPK